MTVVNVSKKNYCLDFIKGIACICVVFMHCEFPGILGTIIQCVSRFCVPFFFMVSGYFCYYEDGRTNVAVKKIKHIGKIILWASAFYVVWALVKCIPGGGYFSVSLKSVIYFAVFNQPVIIVGQLWFLFALLYDYVLYGFVEKLKLHKLAYVLIIILIASYIVLAQGAHLLGISIPNMVYRNWLIEGFPLFMLGHWLHNNKERLKIQNNALIMVIIISTGLCLVERALMGRDFGVNICTFVQVTAMFIFAIKNADAFQNNPLRLLGEKYSMLIYIFHPFIWQSLSYVYSIMELSENILALYVMPILVLFFTLLMSKLFLVLKEKYRKN